MEKVKTYRVTLIVDQGWLDAISDVTSYVEDGEVCIWDHVSDPVEEDPEKYWMTDEEFAALLEDE